MILKFLAKMLQFWYFLLIIVEVFRYNLGTLLNLLKKKSLYNSKKVIVNTNDTYSNYIRKENWYKIKKLNYKDLFKILILICYYFYFLKIASRLYNVNVSIIIAQKIDEFSADF